MQLAILLVVICAVSGAGSQAVQLDHIGWRLLQMAAFLAAGPLTALAGRAVAARGMTSDVISWRRHHERWEMLTGGLWVGGSLAALYVARWPDIVRSLQFTLDWPLLDDVLILAPLMASLLMVWVAQYRIERIARTAADGPNAGADVTLGRYVALRVRHHLGLTLLPALVILGVLESAVKLNLTSGADDARTGWIWTALLAMAVIALPLMLKWLWQAQRVADSPLKERLLASCRRIGCGVRDIVVWRTGGAVANAAVAGLIPGLRTIFLSDGLIARLTDDELDVVVRHEAAHLAQRHLWQRLALLSLPVLAYVAIQSQWPYATSQLQSWIALAGISPLWQMTLLAPLAAVIYALIFVGRLARLQEHDADLAACCAASSGGVQRGICAAGLAVDPSAVDHLHSALTKLVGDSGEYRRGRWLHPSVTERVEFLSRVQNQPLLAPRFRRRLLGLSCLLLAAFLATLLVGIWPT